MPNARANDKMKLSITLIMVSGLILAAPACSANTSQGCNEKALRELRDVSTDSMGKLRVRGPFSEASDEAYIDAYLKDGLPAMFTVQNRSEHGMNRPDFIGGCFV